MNQLAKLMEKAEKFHCNLPLLGLLSLDFVAGEK